MAHLVLELHAHAWLWLVDLPMLALSPRSALVAAGAAPGLLWVLFVGLRGGR